ncbi:hypothetical protein GCM10010415_64860 [Streptomyces atrovirens]
MMTPRPLTSEAFGKVEFDYNSPLVPGVDHAGRLETEADD